MYSKRKERIRIARARNLARTLKQSSEYRRTYRYRIRIEHTFAEAKEHHGLGRARSYGLAAVDEQVKMTAVAQNIKRQLLFYTVFLPTVNCSLVGFSQHF
ncbi:hypothetical protein E308F_22620 [Moorella sp. E308F]|uniref:transposase n=1 Tax=Moorella sp. E308F TaxID=2572682 RepID=UPI0010FFAC73|nr:hypothetical protein E308F_22620 [Moorella sp. E308F]